MTTKVTGSVLANTSVIAGTYGAASLVPIITVDAQGRITSATAATVSGAGAGVGATTYTVTKFTATAGQTVFSVNYSVGYIQVYLNGVLLDYATEFTATNGTSITLITPAALSDIITVYAYSVNTIANIAGGAPGTVIYQSAANTTSNTDVGTSSHLLTSAGAGKPYWSAQTSLSIANTQITGTITASQLGTTQNPQFNSLGVGTSASGTSGEIRATNNITAYYSDDRLKTKLGNIENALEKVTKLNGFYYEANEVAQALGYSVKKEVGVSAQEIQQVLPEIIAPAPIDDKYLTVHYERIIPLLIEAIKELEQKVEELKQKI